jgi:DNA N-6-adenine-methyltransferase (Dam)
MNHGWHVKTDNSQEWYTPKYILDALGRFDLDPCSPHVRPFDTARRHYTKKKDGLRHPWMGRVWLNPPYDEIHIWMNRMARHGNGIALTFARIGTHWFDSIVMPYTTGLLFLTGNLEFLSPDGEIGAAAPTPSVLIAYDPPGTNLNNMALRRCGLPGNFWDRLAHRQGSSDESPF